MYREETELKLRVRGGKNYKIFFFLFETLNNHSFRKFSFNFFFSVLLFSCVDPFSFLLFLFSFFWVSCMMSDMCGCSLKLIRISLRFFYFILFFVCVLHEFVLGCCLSWSLLLVNFIFELVKFISYFLSIKFLITFKKINNFVEGSKCKFIEINC